MIFKFFMLEFLPGYFIALSEIMIFFRAILIDGAKPDRILNINMDNKLRARVPKLILRYIPDKRSFELIKIIKTRAIKSAIIPPIKVTIIFSARNCFISLLIVAP